MLTTDIEASGLSGKGQVRVFLVDARSHAILSEALVALANGSGGTLFLGVDPRTGEPVGLSDPEAALDRALQAALSIEPPLIIPLPSISDIEGRKVLVVTVPPGLPHVYCYKGRYLVRHGNRNRPLDPPELRRLMMARGAAGFESLIPPGARLADLDADKVERYLPAVGRPDTAPDEILLRRGCLAESNGELRPTYAGLLLFGRDPQRWVRSGVILVVRYAGTSMRDSFIKEEVRGTLPDQIRRAETFVVGNLRRGVRLSGMERIEELEYPVEALREAIVNAVAHRDYQIQGDEIRILIYTDRIEFYSPGRLPGHITVENLVQERFSRNEILVQVLSDMGFIERLGYGIDRMIRLMDVAGLPPPRFEERAAGFQVTLVGRSARFLDEYADTGHWRHLGLNERQEMALSYLSEKGRITNREFQELCPDVSAETIRRDLADLVERSLLLKIGEKRATYYIFK